MLLTDVDKIQAGIGDKVEIAQQSTMQLIGGIAIGIAYGWRMALVVLAYFLLLDATNDDGYIPTLDEYKGVIEFNNVSFAYPLRPDQLVLRNVSFQLDTNKTTALVGQSGCGKSTCVKLIQRFYDPLAGTITLDGRDIRELNLKWLRQLIGVVAQEPSLFDTTVRENIRMRRFDVTDEEIIESLQTSNVYQFVRALPNHLDTRIGLASLSGGQ